MRTSSNWTCSKTKCSRKRKKQRRIKRSSKRKEQKNTIKNSKRIPKSSNNNTVFVTTLTITSEQKLRIKFMLRTQDIWKLGKVFRIKPKQLRMWNPRSTRGCKSRRIARSSFRSLLSNRIRYSNRKTSNCNKTRSKECKNKNHVESKRLQKPKNRSKLFSRGLKSSNKRTKNLKKSDWKKFVKGTTNNIGRCKNLPWLSINKDRIRQLRAWQSKSSWMSNNKLSRKYFNEGNRKSGHKLKRVTKDTKTCNSEE